jgi:hypothetical protein
MKQWRNKVVSMILAIAMVFGMCTAVYASEVNELTGHWAEKTIKEWITLGLLKGDQNGRYNPDANISRAEFMAIVNRVMNYTDTSDSIRSFTDVSSGKWYYDDAAKALAAGYINGTAANTLSPEDTITREQAITIISRIKGIDPSGDTGILAEVGDSSEISEWAKNPVAVAIREGLVTGSGGRINPTANITRCEAVVLLDRVRTNTRIYYFTGTYGPESGTATANMVVIASPGINLRNVIVNGNLEIAGAAGDGEVVLNNVIVGGDMLVYGGNNYFSNIIVSGCIIGRRDDPGIARISVSGNSTVNTVLLESGAIVDTEKLVGGGIEEVVLSAGSIGSNPVRLIGQFGTVTNALNNAHIKLTNTNIKIMNLNAATVVEADEASTIATANISGNAAEGSELNIMPDTLTGDGAKFIKIISPAAISTPAPTVKPTTEPSSKPTTPPNTRPTKAPTAAPTTAPTAKPTAEPTATPTTVPTAKPTAEPTTTPTVTPTPTPTTNPTPTPSQYLLYSKTNLKGWYRFEENLTDYSGNHYHGVAYGETSPVTGSVHNAYDFDGIDDYVLVSNDYSIVGDNQSFTAAAWIKPSDLNESHWIIGNEKGWSMFMFGFREGKLELYWRYGPSATTFSLKADYPVNDAFNHVAAVYDGSSRNAYLYINGELAASDTTTKPLALKMKENLTIGRGMSGNEGQFYKGIIDEVRIYNIPLSAEEIQFMGKDSHRDTVPPSVPTNVNAVAGSSTHVNLDWSACTDNMAFSGYRVLRNGRELAFLDKPEYIDYGVSANTTYSYTICAYDSSGNESKSSEVSIKTPIANSVHPKMFFTPADIPTIRQNANTTHAEICREVIKKANGLLTADIPEYPGVASGYSKYAENPVYLAFAYSVTGDTQYLNRSKEYLLAYSSWPSWGDDSAVTERDYPMAYMTIGVALSYDWLYESLTETERNTIREALGVHLQELYEASSGPHTPEWYNWWRKSYMQNHFTQCVAAIGIGSLVLEGEDSRTDAWLSHAIEQSMRTKAIYDGIGDGSWHEGIYYQHSGQLLWVLPFYHTLEQIKGVNLYSDTYFKNYLYWTLYNYRPKSNLAVLPFGSYVPGWGGWTAAGAFTFPRSIDARYETGYGVWLTEHLAPYTVRNDWHAMAYVFEFFYVDSSLKSVSPDALPLSRTFDDAQAVIWRTGWDDNALIFGLKTGPYGGRFAYENFHNQSYPFEERDCEFNVGHNHQCAGTFYLYKGGVDLASEMPDRHGNTISETVHNVVMIDGRGQYKANYDARTFPDTVGTLELSYGTKGYDYLVTDLTNCYREINDDNVGTPGNWKVNEYKRHVLFARPGYFLMLDNLDSDTKHRYDWVCHFSENPKAATVVEGDWIRSTVSDSENTVLGIKVLSPEGFTYELGESEHPYSGDPPKTKPYIRVHPKSNVDDTQFVTVLYPTSLSSWNEKPEISLVENTGEAVLVRVIQNGDHDHLIRYGSNENVSAGEYRLTGQNLSITKDASGNLQSVFLGQGKHAADTNGQRILVESAEVVTVEVNYGDKSIELYGDDPTGLQIYAPGIQEVLWNNVSVPFTRQGDYIFIS